jgi:ectoine hydroxylase-related dioxygenase (phytanoyl-CoA dioxygenase family)
MSIPTATARPFIEASDCHLDDFVAQVSRDTEPADYPHACDVRSNVLVYRADSVINGEPRDVNAELIHALTDGPGVLVVEGAFEHGVVDAASEAFWTLITEQHAGGTAAGDHFSQPGTNDRVWNAAQKLALHDPRLFAEYYSNEVLATVSQAWLGPRYEMTSQVNVVNPGGAAQVPHRDYHLAMIPGDQLAAYPAHLHRMSSVLTLQGAVAHCDMPQESGPTMFLPYS